MEAELKKLLEPVINKFIESLVKARLDWEHKYKTALTQINESLAQELEGFRKGQESLKAQKEENEKVTALTKAKLEDAVAKQTTLNNDLSKEAAQYTKLSKEYAEKLKTIEDNLKSSSSDKSLTAEALEKANNAFKNYQAKLNSLKQDSDKILLQQSQIEEREKITRSKEKANLNEESKQIEEAHRLNDVELKLRAREAEVNRLIKRYKLEESIKGA